MPTSTGRQEQRGCAQFWGPTKPFAGSDTGLESGASFYLSTPLFLVWRTLTLSFLVAVLIYLIIIGQLSLLYVTNWSYVLFTITWALITITSLMLQLRKTAFADMLAQFAVPLHFVSASASLYVVPVYWALLFESPALFRQVFVHGGTLVLYLIDIVLGSRIRFKIQYTVFAFAYFVLYIIFIWIRYAVWNQHPDFFWPYPFLDIKVTPPALLAGIYVGLLVFDIVVSVVMVLSTRLVPLCAAPRKLSNERTPRNGV